MRNKRRIVQHQFALPQSALHHAILAEITLLNRLLQVSDPAVHKFRGSAGGRRDEVARLQQNRSQPPKLRVQRAARSRCPTANYAHIESRALDLFGYLGAALHACFPLF